MSADAEQELTDQVVATFAGAESARLREVMQSLVRHLHGFARDVRLTQEEWEHAIDFLTRVGHLTDERRQEFILLSDVLGLSMLTVGINAPASTGATESTVFGPFFVAGAPQVPLGGDIAAGAAGVPCYVCGTVRGVDGTPVAAAVMDVWEADGDGQYDVEYADGRTATRGQLRTDADGGYRFWSVRPTAYSIPDDGPVGELLQMTGRGSMRPAHLHFKVSAPGYRTLITHVFAAGDDHLDDDVVFGVKDSLVAPFVEQPPGDGPEGRRLDRPWVRLDFDLTLAPDGGGA